MAFAWSWTLRKRVRQRTASLQNELAQRLRAEARVMKLNRLYAVTNEINKAIVRVRNRDSLFVEVCRVIVDHGRFPLAWVGLVDEAEHRVTPVAQAGVGSEYLKEARISTLDSSAEGQGPGGIAAREGRIAISNDIPIEPSMAPWRSAALAHNLRSNASLPIKIDKTTVAILTLYAAEPGFFDDQEELGLLDGVARDISFALEAIDHEHRREYAEQALHESEERFRTAFEQAAVGVALCDAETTILAANSALCEMLGYSREELVGREMLSPDLTHPDDLEVGRHFAVRLLSGELSRGTGEKLYLCKDGHTIWTQVVMAVVRDAANKPLYFINQIQDITAARAAEERLHEAYEDMESIFRASPAAIITLDAGLNVRAWNSSAERMFGWTIDEVLGQKLPIVRPDDWDQTITCHRQTLNGEAISNKEVKVLRRDGAELDVSVSSSPVRDAAGQYTGGVLAFTDVTERKRAEEELRRAYETMDAVVRASPLAIMTLEDHKYVTLWNQAAEQMYGWTEEEVIGRLNPVVPPEEMEGYEKLREALLQGEVVAGKEARGMRKDGTRIDVLYSTAPMRDNQGRFTRGVGMMWDITDRKKAEQELREANATKDTILRASPVALVAHDLQGNVILWNDAAERMFGWTTEEIMGHPVPIIPTAQIEEFYQRRARVLQGEDISNEEMKRLRKDGTLLDVSISITPFRDAEGRIIGALGAYLDVTERKRLEAQLLQSQKLESIGRLAGGIAHDFNNLLTVINCHSDLLLERISPGGPVVDALQEIRKAGEQASSLTRQLLAFSRRQMLQSRVLDLNAIVRDISGMLQRLLGEDIELVIELANMPARVKIDPGQFQQVIMNLAVNARDAMPNGGRLTITTAILEELPVRSGDGDSIDTPQVLLAVRDTGGGMDEETQRRMFEPFFTTKPPGKGTGLGLSMVWGIVKQSGGHLWVQSELGKGTTFTLLLPRVEEPAAVGESRPRRAITLHGSETILLVEDQPQLRELTSHILTGYGYRVLEAANGTEALRIVEQDGTAIDLVVTDIVMPGMTGIELGKRIRNLRPEFKLLYMSGYTDDVILQQGEFEAGAAYIEKPYTPEGLATKIRQVLGVSAAGSESAA
jgi:PAS domain S-box-containing protein